MTHEECWAHLRAAFRQEGIKDFHPDEFVPRRVQVPPPGKLHRVVMIARVYQDLRDDSGDRVNLTSAYRDPSYNAGIGGRVYSQHPEGTAGDGVSRAWTPDQVYGWAVDHRWSRFMGIGRYDTFIHLDVRGFFDTKGGEIQPAPARWDNRTT